MVKVAVFSARPYVKEYFQKFNQDLKTGLELQYFDASLDVTTVIFLIFSFAPFLILDFLNR